MFTKLLKMGVVCRVLWQNVSFVLMVFVALSLSACSQNQTAKENENEIVENEDTLNAGRVKDSAFLALAIEMSIEDVRLAKLVQERSPTESIRELAKKIEAGHTMILNHVKVISEKKGLPLSPKKPEENELDVLVNLEGTSLDEEFCGYMAKEHENAIDTFEKAVADKFMDADIKNWADSMIPVFRSNMEAAAMQLAENDI